MLRRIGSRPEPRRRGGRATGRVNSSRDLPSASRPRSRRPTKVKATKVKATKAKATKELDPAGTAPAPRQRNVKGQSVSTPPRRPPAREKKATKDLDCARAAPAQRASKAKGKSVAAPARGQRGSRNKIGEAFIDALYKDWQKHGKTAIQTARDKYPTGYLRVVSSLLPKPSTSRTTRLTSSRTRS